jgi:hypothetical protein
MTHLAVASIMRNYTASPGSHLNLDNLRSQRKKAPEVVRISGAFTATTNSL